MQTLRVELSHLSKKSGALVPLHVYMNAFINRENGDIFLYSMLTWGIWTEESIGKHIQ